MLPMRCVELHHADLTAISSTASRKISCNCEDGAICIPFDATCHHTRVNKDRILVHLMSHELQTAVLKADGQNGLARILETLDTVIPIDSY